MSAWPRVRLDQCTEVVSGATPDTSESSYWDGDICWATPKDLSELDGAYISDTPRKITRRGLESCAASVLPPESVLFSSRAPIGHVAINTVPMATNQGFKSFVPDRQSVDAKFLYHWLRKNRPYLESLGNGATFKEVSKAVVSRIEIALPLLPEQRRIAEILDKADALRAKRRAALAQLDTLTQSIFLDMFGDPATNPKRWPVVPLESKCTIAGEYGANVASSSFDPDLSRYVRITDVTEEGELNDRPVSPSGSPNDWEPYELAPGDLLFARSGATVGKTYMHRDSNGRCVFAGYMIRFRPDRRELLPEYIFAFTRSAAYRAWVAVRQRVVAQPNINAKQYGRELLIPLPPIRQQEVFAARMVDVARTKSLMGESRAELDRFFASLQHRAFRGEL
jgi:type I restriction enzyme S subunit